MKPVSAPKRETITRKEVPVNGIPWQWGYDARMDGYGRATCPFAEGYPARVQWIAGYESAKVEQYTPKATP